MSPDAWRSMVEAEMEAAVNIEPQTPTRGDALLLHHLVMVDDAEPRLPARVRLEQALGGELSALLLGALAPEQD
jgi:hypothetical protein